MKKFTFNFLGVKNGSIGKKAKFTVTTEAENFDKAMLKLYDTHEHIQVLKVNGKAVDKDYTFAEFKEEEIELFTFIVTKDGEEKARFKDQSTDFEPFKYILNHQSQSTQWAMRYEGWKVQEINQKTKESYFWKP